MESYTKAFKILSDANRLRILKMLEVRPLCVCEITAILGLAPSTVSKHLSLLKETGFIFEQKEGKWVNYHLNRATQKDAVKELLPIVLKRSHEDPLFKKDHEKISKIHRENLCSL